MHRYKKAPASSVPPATINGDDGKLGDAANLRCSTIPDADEIIYSLWQILKKARPFYNTKNDTDFDLIYHKINTCCLSPN